MLSWMDEGNAVIAATVTHEVRRQRSLMLSE
jgi:hypothetical protein